MISVNDAPVALSSHHYCLTRDVAILEGGTAWLKDGVESAIIARRNPDSDQREVFRLEQLLRIVGLRYSFANLGEEKIRRFIKTLAKQEQSQIILVGDRFSALLCCRAPETMCALFEEKRVMLASGPAVMPFFAPPSVPVDLVSFDWQLVAERIAADLVEQTAFDPGSPMVFEASWLSRTPLDRHLVL